VFIWKLFIYKEISFIGFKSKNSNQFSRLKSIQKNIYIPFVCPRIYPKLN